MTLTHVTHFMAKSALFGGATFALIATSAVGMSISTRSLSVNCIQNDLVSTTTTIANEFEPPPGRGEPDGTVGLGLG